MFPFRRHCSSTSAICVASTTPAKSTLPSAATSARVPRIGPDEITGEATRTRRSARADRDSRSGARASRRASARTRCRTCASPTRIGSVATLPDAATFRFFHSCAKSSWKRIATPVDSTTTMTFSSRVHESSVQFVDPLQTASRSRTTYLWCIRSGQPGTAAVSNGSDSIRSGSVFGGGGTGGRSSTSSTL